MIIIQYSLLRILHIDCIIYTHANNIYSSLVSASSSYISSISLSLASPFLYKLHQNTQWSTRSDVSNLHVHDIIRYRFQFYLSVISLEYNCCLQLLTLHWFLLYYFFSFFFFFFLSLRLFFVHNTSEKYKYMYGTCFVGGRWLSVVITLCVVG